MSSTADEDVALDHLNQVASSDPAVLANLAQGFLDVAHLCSAEARRHAARLWPWASEKLTSNRLWRSKFGRDGTEPLPLIIDGESISRQTSIHPIILEHYALDDKISVAGETRALAVSGFYLILTILIHLNMALVPFMDAAMSENRHLFLSAFKSASMGNADEATGWGIYLILMLNGRGIIGQTLRHFFQRMVEYRKGNGNKWFKAFPDAENDFDAIVAADLSPLNAAIGSPHLRSIITLALETFIMAICNTTDPDVGGNKNLFDGLVSLTRPKPIDSEIYIQVYLEVYRWTQANLHRPLPSSTSQADLQWWSTTFKHCFASDQNPAGSTIVKIIYNFHRYALANKEFGLPDLGAVWSRGLPAPNRHCLAARLEEQVFND